MRAAILGASGLVGQELVDRLLAEDAYSEVHVLVRARCAVFIRNWKNG